MAVCGPLPRDGISDLKPSPAITPPASRGLIFVLVPCIGAVALSDCVIPNPIMKKKIDQPQNREGASKVLLAGVRYVQWHLIFYFPVAKARNLDANSGSWGSSSSADPNSD